MLLGQDKNDFFSGNMSQHGGCLVDMGAGSGGNISPGSNPFLEKNMLDLLRPYRRFYYASYQQLHLSFKNWKLAI